MATGLVENNVFNNEINFCKVFTQEAKTALERAFLSQRISYFVEWQDKTIWQRLFGAKGNRISCIIRINSADYDRARMLVEHIEDIKIRDMHRENTKDPVRDLAKGREQTRKKKQERKIVIQKTSSGKK